MIIEVKLYNKTIGSIEWNDIKGSATFQYSEYIPHVTIVNNSAIPPDIELSLLA